MTAYLIIAMALCVVCVLFTLGLAHPGTGKGREQGIEGQGTVTRA